MNTLKNTTFCASSPVALIGAGGFLGINLAHHLASQVNDLRCFGRQSSFPNAFHGLRWIAGDTTDDTVTEALVGCHTVIHLASTSTPATADRHIATDAQANIVASLQLFDRCIAAGVKRIVFISSGGTVYGIPTIVPTPESAQTLPITAYGVAKLAIEKYLEVYLRQRGLDYIVLRIANPYGPFQTTRKQQGVIAAFLTQALRGSPLEIWGDGHTVRDYVYVADVAKAVISALKYKGNQRIFNIGSDVGLSIIDIIAAMETLFGRTLEKHFRAGRTVDVPVSILDCDLAEKELGWHADTSFSDGLRLTVDWMRSQ
jgi:UDP-glucose 4-epimerase